MAPPSSSAAPPIPKFPHRGDSYFRDAKIRVWWDTDTAPLPPSAEPRDLIANIVKAIENAGYRGNKIVFWGRVRKHGLSMEVLEKIEIGILKGYPQVREPSRITSAYPYPRDDDKDGVYRHILFDMFQSSRLAKYPVNHMLITGNKLFLRSLCVLKHWGHNILIARPSTAYNLYDDCQIATTIWDWNDIAEGRRLLLLRDTIIQPLNTNQEATSDDNGANEASDLSSENMQLRQLTIC